MDQEQVRKNIIVFKKTFPKNRLIRHLEDCACINGCPAAKNFFLKRHEAPLPVSPTCNCQCLGCISYQPETKIPVTQPRIRFTPSAQEIAETALFHIRHVRDPVVSFGQGCEGEPLMAAPVIEEAIRLIRSRTSKGVINLNTNASKPGAIARLFDAGLDSMRVSLNSTQEQFYNRYYRPRKYTFQDVCASIEAAGKRNGFISLNYLVMPGLTDSWREYESFYKFMSRYPVSMIQWRNLNFDPWAYFSRIGAESPSEDLLGVEAVIRYIHHDFPWVMKGYFNPSRARMQRHMPQKPVN